VTLPRPAETLPTTIRVQVAQAFRTERLLPMQDLVAGLADDPELAARIDHRQVASLHRHDELHPLVHRVGWVQGIRGLDPRRPEWSPAGATHVPGNGRHPCTWVGPPGSAPLDHLPDPPATVRYRGDPGRAPSQIDDHKDAS
jgi:hypothetical protein